ncbi:MAG: nucleoside hydrolase, partial [Candidatus Solibacter usitatus]|nr:nucleoside hydrolase [Candidatus Solibacter usitatus]
MKWLLLMALAIRAESAERVIIDTDCGYFGDDAAAIAMLLRSPKTAAVEGITLVSGNVWAQSSAVYVKEILTLLGARVPVYFGMDAPLRFTQALAEEAKAKWGPMEFRGAFDEKKPAARPKEEAVDYLIRTVEANPGQITLVGLGPLTNIARMLQRKPDVAKKIRRLVLMGGQFRVPGNASKEAEFNFWFDPEAASQVFRSEIPVKVMFGLDVCEKALLNKAAFDAIAARKTPFTNRFAEDYGVRYPGFYKNPKATVSLWDALVPAWMIDASMFGKPEILRLDVVTEFGPRYG